MYNHRHPHQCTDSRLILELNSAYVQDSLQDSFTQVFSQGTPAVKRRCSLQGGPQVYSSLTTYPEALAVLLTSQPELACYLMGDPSGESPSIEQQVNC